MANEEEIDLEALRAQIDAQRLMIHLLLAQVFDTPERLKAERVELRRGFMREADKNTRRFTLMAGECEGLLAGAITEAIRRRS